MKKRNKKDNYYTITEYQTVSGLSRNKIVKLIKTGVLEAIQIGGSGPWYIPKEKANKLI